MAATIDDDEVDFFDDDTYVSDSEPNSIFFSVKHLYATVDVSGPALPNFPLSIKALLDIGCPSTVISGNLAARLGLRRFPLPKEEDNLSLLSNSPLRCSEYVKLEVTSGKGSWKSQTSRAKINEGLPVPLILGMPFLAADHIVIDARNRTAIAQETGFDLINHVIPKRIWQPERITPPPTPPKPKKPPPVTIENAPAPKLDAAGLPSEVMAAVRERLETLSQEEKFT